MRLVDRKAGTMNELSAGASSLGVGLLTSPPSPASGLAAFRFRV
jgi:hypothetical protein